MDYKPKIDHYKSQIKTIESEGQNIINISNLAIGLSQKLLLSLKKDIENRKFNSIDQEIYFFKKVKHIPLTKLIYYREIIRFETYFPKVNSKDQIKFVEKKLTALNQYFMRHIDFGHYIDLKCIHLDEYYFTRQNLVPDAYYSMKIFYPDPNFNTSKDFLFGEFKAKKKLAGYIKSRLTNENSLGKIGVSLPLDKLKWTGNKIDLIELIYALKASGAISDGQTGIKEIASTCEILFDIKLGNWYRKFLEIRSRKIERTKFIDRLKLSLIRRMEDAEV